MAEGAEKAAENAFWQALGRSLLPAVCSITLCLGTFLGIRVINQQDQMIATISEMKTDLAVLKANFEFLRAGKTP